MSRTEHTGLPHFGGVALAGFMGAGKSTVGERLAARTGWRWVDLDCRVSETTGQTIPQLFSRIGEAGFRARELETLRELLQDADGPRVLSLGGGALLDPEAVRLLKRHHFRLVVLGVSADTALVRIQGSERPLGAQLRVLHGARATHYASLGPVVSTDARTPEEVVDAVLRLL